MGPGVLIRSCPRGRCWSATSRTACSCSGGMKPCRRLRPLRCPIRRPPLPPGGGGGGAIDAISRLDFVVRVRDVTRPSQLQEITTMDYLPADSRYQTMRYNRVGASGLRLPAISLGLWHNFGDVDVFQNGRTIARRAFDLGITHFDLANNYGPSPGSAEENFGALMQQGFPSVPRRDDHLVEGGLSHVAGAVRRVGFAQVPGGELRPVPQAHGPAVRRHLLQPSLRSGHAARGDHGRARLHRALGPRAVCRHLELQRASRRRAPRRYCASSARPA